MELNEELCYFCGDGLSPKHKHHIIPQGISEMFTGDVSETVTLCPNCHMKLHLVTKEMERLLRSLKSEGNSTKAINSSPQEKHEVGDWERRLMGVLEEIVKRFEETEIKTISKDYIHEMYSRIYKKDDFTIEAIERKLRACLIFENEMSETYNIAEIKDGVEYWKWFNAPGSHWMPKSKKHLQVMQIINKLCRPDKYTYPKKIKMVSCMDLETMYFNKFPERNTERGRAELYELAFELGLTYNKKQSLPTLCFKNKRWEKFYWNWTGKVEFPENYVWGNTPVSFEWMDGKRWGDMPPMWSRVS